jgi:hypothetical protein
MVGLTTLHYQIPIPEYQYFYVSFLDILCHVTSCDVTDRVKKKCRHTAPELTLIYDNLSNLFHENPRPYNSFTHTNLACQVKIYF